MKGSIKWILWIALVLLIVLAIDFNSYWLKVGEERNRQNITTNLILGGMFVMVAVATIVRKRQ
jgi:uncharacterized membrane protein YphA (DoxX/SURF4 family)